MPNISIWSEEGDSPILSVGKGLTLGGSGLAALYGLNEIKRFIIKKLKDQPKVLPDNIYFRDPHAKVLKLAADESLGSSVLRKFIYGAAIPMGAIGTYQILDYFRNKEEEARIRGKLTELDLALRGRHPDEKLKKASLEKILTSSQIKKETELVKMATDPDINEYLDKFIEKVAGDGPVQTVRDWSKFIVTIPEFAPYVLGIGAGLSGLAGYYGTKYYLDPDSIIPKDILKEPELVFSQKRIPEIKVKKMAELISKKMEAHNNENFIAKTAFTHRPKIEEVFGNSPTLGYTLMKKNAYGYEDTINWLSKTKPYQYLGGLIDAPSGTLKKDTKSIPTKIKDWTAEKATSVATGVKDWVVEKATPVATDIISGALPGVLKKNVGTLLGAGSLLAAPSLISGLLTMNNKNTPAINGRVKINQNIKPPSSAEAYKGFRQGSNSSSIVPASQNHLKSSLM